MKLTTKAPLWTGSFFETYTTIDLQNLISNQMQDQLDEGPIELELDSH